MNLAAAFTCSSTNVLSISQLGHWSKYEYITLI